MCDRKAISVLNHVAVTLCGNAPIGNCLRSSQLTRLDIPGGRLDPRLIVRSDSQLFCLQAQGQSLPYAEYELLIGGRSGVVGMCE